MRGGKPVFTRSLFLIQKTTLPNTIKFNSFLAADVSL
jgi:hypothetical protein